MKANTKAKADTKLEPAAAGGSRNKLLVVAAIVAVVAAASATGAWFMLKPGSPKAPEVKPSVFVPLDRFVVNLQPEEDGDAYLQVDVTLQLPDAEQEDQVKQYMPQVRSRVLLLLSGKHKSEISTVEGKNQLATEIATAVRQPFSPQAKPQSVTGVHFTSFVIQ